MSDGLFSEARAKSGWALPVHFWQPRNPAFWLYAVLVPVGAYMWVQSLLDAHVSIQTLIVALLLQATYTLPFVWFITRADRYEREPAKLALLAFLWGGLVSTFLMAASANAAVLSLWGKLVSVDFATFWGPALTAPFTEEIAKLTGVAVAALLARQHVRSTFDGMIMGMFVGLGFQVFENVQYLVNFVATNFNSAPALDLALVFGFRGLTGLWGHWLFTGLTGAGVGYFLGATDKPMANRLGVATLFILFSMLCHGLFDAGGVIGPWGMAIAVPLMTMGFIVAWKFAGRRARTWMRVLLDGEVSAGTITSEELDILAGPHKNRRKYLKSIKRRDGVAASKKANQILAAATRLASAIAATDDGQSAGARSARAELTRLRLSQADPAVFAP